MKRLGDYTRRLLTYGWRGLKLLPLLPYIILILLFLVTLPLLQAYFALTREATVAQVVMSPIQRDGNGSTYIDIEFTPLEHPSAWYTAINGEIPDGQLTPGETQFYRVYGDTVAVRGPMITLQQGWRILNFDNIYKLALIEGEYRFPGNTGQGSEFEINGGFEASWWDINSREATFPYNTVIKRITFTGDEEPGFTGPNRKLYEIVVTVDTITWNYIRDVTE